MDNSAVQSEFIFYVDISVLICFFYAVQTYLYDNLISLIISNKEYIKYWTEKVYKTYIMLHHYHTAFKPFKQTEKKKTTQPYKMQKAKSIFIKHNLVRTKLSIS